ncbi:four-carbon acid sugar kinase family protein [Phytohabitans flavus]|uniref:four-carbon acid sugar kinase family protein n=1 Tax=Phytohabitans flavus TaxID=1076124 RepID=UPI00363995B3
MPARQLLVIADDLTGGADAGVRFARAGMPTRLLIDSRSADLDGDLAGALVVDTDSRQLPPDAARRLVRDTARRVSAGHVVKKVDSLLRGPLAAELLGLLDALPGTLIVLAPALPAASRTTVDGVQHVDGTPLHRTAAWAAEPRPPAPDIATQLAPLRVTQIGLHCVRGGRLTAAIDAATTPIVLCDATTDADLAAIVYAGLASRRPICWAGSAGLTSALAAALAPAEPSGAADALAELIGTYRDAVDRPYLAVVGSATPVALAQAEELAARGAQLLSIPAEDLVAGHGDLAARISRTAAVADTVVRVDGGVDPAATGRVAAALAAVTAPAATRARLLLLTGGSTARGVLTGADVASLWLLAEPEPGVVVSADPATGRLVVTKAGSFGDPHTLGRAVAALRRTPHPYPGTL